MAQNNFKGRNVVDMDSDERGMILYPREGNETRTCEVCRRDYHIYNGDHDYSYKMHCYSPHHWTTASNTSNAEIHTSGKVLRDSDRFKISRYYPTAADKCASVDEAEGATLAELKDAKVAALKEEEGKVAAVKEEEGKVAAVKEEEGKVAAVKEEESKVTAVKEEEGKVTVVKEEEGKVTPEKEAEAATLEETVNEVKTTAIGDAEEAKPASVKETEAAVLEGTAAAEKDAVEEDTAEKDKAEEDTAEKEATAKEEAKEGKQEWVFRGKSRKSKDDIGIIIASNAEEPPPLADICNFPKILGNNGITKISGRQQYKCNVCNVRISGIDCAIAHSQGKLHNKKQRANSSK